MKRAHFCTIGVIRIAFLGPIALLLVAPATYGQGASFPTLDTRVALVQKFQPVLRSYPGVRADMLGIRTGMSVIKAEAVAAKSYGGKTKPFVSQLSDSLIYGPGNFTIQSRPFVGSVSFTRSRGIMLDMLELHFGSPVTGNTLLGMTRNISYSPTRSQKTPSIRLIKSLLVRKYGPPSYQSQTQEGGLTMGWVFGQTKRFACKTDGCVGGHFTGVPTVFSSSGDLDKSDLRTPCGVAASGPNIFTIDANINARRSAKTEVSGVIVSLWNAVACLNDGMEAKRQLMAAASKYWKVKYKPRAGPKL